MVKAVYDESAVDILEGLEPVRLRPGQFTRTDCPLHIIQEVLDNCVDEAIGGYAKHIGVSLLPDGFIRISDDGRGIPVGKHPTKGIPVVEAIFTVLYSGGKFRKTSGGGAYGYAGGLHGVGVSVTNALSESLVAQVTREGKVWEIGFSGGTVVQPLKKVGSAPAGISGTAITVKPDPRYFDSPALPIADFRRLLQTKAVLLPGLRVTFEDLRNPEAPERDEFLYHSGMTDYLQELVGEAPLIPLIEGEAYVKEGDAGEFSAGEGAAWVVGLFEGTGSSKSFVNLIPTPEHGTHVAGLRNAVFNAVKGYIEFHALLPKGVKLTADDSFRNVCFVLSTRMLDPSFDNQTKDRLNTREAVRLIERQAQPLFEAWMNKNTGSARVWADMAIRHAQARLRAAKTMERRKTSSVVMLPGKLSDCESENSAETELFIVEGDSAGGSAKQGRDRRTQAILPIRGKSLNVWEKTASEALASEEIHSMATAIGIAPHTRADTVDWTKLRYGIVGILADADNDGAHIQVLLLTLFLRHFPQLVDRGHVYIACPPLYRLDVDPAGKSKPARKIYAVDEAELAQWESRLKREGYKNWHVGRFKGLGEMNPPELWETTLCPETRVLRQITPLADAEDVALTEGVFDNLMAGNKSGWRREWLERRGNELGAFNR